MICDQKVLPQQAEYLADVKRWREDFFLWQRSQGSYRPKSKEWVRAFLARYMGNRGLNATLTAVKNLEESVKALSMIEDEFKPPRWLNGFQGLNESGVFISFKNGVLNLEKPEEGLIPHTPDFWTLFSLPYDFNLEATCPLWEEALELWQPDEECRLLMQSWAGYCLMPGNPFQVFLLNLGEGGDGKSQWAYVLRALLGEGNVGGVGLEAFDPRNRFGLEPLLGATLNIVGDANDIEKMGEGVLKAIVGGDPITIDRKNKSAITDVLTCKFSMNCNSLPPFRDRTEGLWRRMLLLLWDQTIPKEKRVADFGKMIVEREIQGVFNWALCGFHRIRKEGFKINPTGKIMAQISEARSTIQREREFFSDCLGWDSDPKTIVSLSLPALVNAYKAWCSEHNVRPSLFGHNLGKCMMAWLRETYPDHRLKFGSGPGCIKQRKNAIEGDEGTRRRWSYRGVYLRRETIDLAS